MKTIAIFLDDKNQLERVFSPSQLDRIRTMGLFHPRIISSENFDSELVNLENLEVIFSTWGMPCLNARQISCLPKLKAVFYAAGSVKYFAKPFLDAGVRVFSAWKVNAIPVAEYTLANILLACKRFLPNIAHQRKTDALYWSENSPSGHGIYKQRIAILGLGAIGNRVLELLAPFDLEAVSVSSYPAERIVSLEEAFETCYVVSNHFPNCEDNQRIFNAALFRRMPYGATFINTGRGAQVDEADLIQVMKERPDLTAILDVTDPEPPAENSELRLLPNIHLSSHIAGSTNHEILRMGDLMIEEYRRWETDQPCPNEVNLQTFAMMA